MSTPRIHARLTCARSDATQDAAADACRRGSPPRLRHAKGKRVALQLQSLAQQAGPQDVSWFSKPAHRTSVDWALMLRYS